MRVLLTLIPLAGFAADALAADLPPRAAPPVAALPLFTWTGLYSGLFAGYGQIDNRTRPACIGADGLGDGLRCPVRSALSPRADDFAAGTEIGYTYQLAPGPGLVVGAAADYQFTPIRSYGLETGAFAQGGLPGTVYPGGVYHAGQRLDWLATARAKVGYAVDRAFVYGTGGVAFGGVRIDTTTTADAGLVGERVNRPDFDGRKGALRTGWVAGGGVEYAIGPHLSVKGEALYYDLGARTVLAGDASRFRPNVTAGTRVETSGVLGRVGLNYRFDDGLPVIGPVVDVAKALIDPVPYVAPVAQVWGFEIGTRYVYSAGRFGKSFYRPANEALISRLTYRDFDAHSGETFARLDHAPTGLFVKGFLGSGFVASGGRLNDEDFPPGIPGNVYSNTRSKIRDGDVALSAIDAGYTFWRDDAYRLGAFLGYQSTVERANAVGLVQLAGNPAIGARGVPNGVSVLTQDNHWSALRVGLAGETRYDRFTLSLEGAYLPVVGLDGYDRHWLRPDINPLAERGTGRGYFLQGVIAYDLTPTISLGVGARAWRMTVDRQDGTTRFPTLAEPAKFASERYGAFAQISYRFTDPDFGLGGAGSR
jgi:opacity protein-like surface antigen